MLLAFINTTFGLNCDAQKVVLYPTKDQFQPQYIKHVPQDQRLINLGRHFGWNFRTITADRRKKSELFLEKKQRLQAFIQKIRAIRAVPWKFLSINCHPYLRIKTEDFESLQS